MSAPGMTSEIDTATPTRLFAALARTPRSWVRFLRLQAARLSGPLTAGAGR